MTSRAVRLRNERVVSVVRSTDSAVCRYLRHSPPLDATRRHSPPLIAAAAAVAVADCAPPTVHSVAISSSSVGADPRPAVSSCFFTRFDETESTRRKVFRATVRRRAPNVSQHRSKMQKYTKKYIDNLVHKAIFMKCTVSLTKLSEEDIKRIKLSLIKKKPKKSESGDEPVKKKPKIDTSEVDILKMVLSREGGSDKFKSKFKSSLEPSKENIPSTSTQDKPKEVDFTVSTEITTSSTNLVIGKIWCRDYRTMMDESCIASYKINFLNLKPQTPLNGITNPVLSVKPSPSRPRQSVNENKPSTSGSKQIVNKVRHPPNSRNLSMRENLNKIEQLYTKYFSKFVQDTILTIANIVNIISMTNKNHKERVNESFKKKTEAERLKGRCYANRLHDNHKRILEDKLKKYFSIVVTSFGDSEFDSTFRMFFLSILTILRVLDQPKFKKGSIFKNLVYLLWNSLKNTKYENPKVYSMFRSNKFRPDCIDLIGLIEDSRDSDPGITDRMSLFFVSTVNSTAYFQAVIDYVTSNSYKDLGIVIDNAYMQCTLNSNFKDPVAVAVINSPDITTVTANETVQQLAIQKKSAGNIQIPLQNGYKSQTNGCITVEPSFVSNFYETFSNSLRKKVSSESSTPKRIPSKKCAVVMPSTSNSPLVQVTALETTTATTSTVGSNKIPMLSNHLNTIYVGNKQYKLIKDPSGQVKALMNGNQVLLKSPPPPVTIKCFTKNCHNNASIMCSKCTSVKYCSQSCQQKDWYSNHIHHCERLLSMKKTTP